MSLHSQVGFRNIRRRCRFCQDVYKRQGLAGAQKKAGRIAAEGIVATCISEDEKHAVVVEVNAETDFVAKNEKFKTYVAEVRCV